MEKKIINLWKQSNFLPVSEFIKFAKERSNFTTKQIRSAILSNFTFSTHVQKRKPKTYRRTFSPGANLNFHADLAVLKTVKYKGKVYKGFLIAVDTFSKKIFVHLLNNFRTTSVKRGFENIFSHNKYPDSIYTDAGSVFTKLKPWFRRKGTILTDKKSSQGKAYIAESRIKSIKTILEKNLIENNTDIWPPLLPKIVQGLNNKINPLWGFAPNDVNKKNEPEIRSKIYPQLKNFKFIPFLKKAQTINRNFYNFKPDKSNYSKRFCFNQPVFLEDAKYSGRIVKKFKQSRGRIYRITKVNASQYPLSYKLRDLQGNELPGWVPSYRISRAPETDKVPFYVDSIIDYDHKTGLYLVKFENYPR